MPDAEDTNNGILAFALYVLLLYGKFMKKIIHLVFLMCSLTASAQWEKISDGLWGSPAEKVIGTDNMLYATARYTDDYYSTDKGFSWTKMGAPVEFVILNANDDYVFARKGEAGFIISSDRGKTWVSEKNILTDSVVSTVSFFNEKVYAITQSGTVFNSTDKGFTWNNMGDKLLGGAVKSIVELGSKIVISTNTGVSSTTDDGNSWKNELESEVTPYTMVVEGETLVAYSGHKIMETTDGGKTWNSIPYVQKTGGCRSFSILNGEYWAIFNNNLYRFQRSAKTWENTTSNNVDPLLSFHLILGKIFIVTKGTILASEDSGKTWHESIAGMTDLNVSTMYAHKDTLYVGGDGGYLQITTDNGNTWKAHKGYTALGYVKDITIDDSIMIVIGLNSVSISVDYGNTWSIVDSLYEAKYTFVVDDKIIVVCESGISYTSADYGKTWIKDLFSTYCLQVYTTACNENTLCISGEQGFFVSEDGGGTWLEKTHALDGEDISALVFDGNDMYAGTTLGTVFFSSNHGDSWRILREGKDYDVIYSIVYFNNIIMIYTQKNEIIYTTDKGNVWKKLNAGFGSSMMGLPLIVTDDYVFSAYWTTLYRLDRRTFTSVPEYSLQNEAVLTISPNPTAYECTIRLKTSTEQPLHYTITSQLGEIVNKGIIPSSTQTFSVPIHTLPAGMYIFSTEVNGKRVNEKVLIQ